MHRELMTAPGDKEDKVKRLPTKDTGEERCLMDAECK